MAHEDSHHLEEKSALIGHNESQALKPVNFLPFDVQLQNTFCREIVARRFPVDIEHMPHVQANLEEAEVDSEQHLAQITLHIQTVNNTDFPPFDISFKLLGIFSYTENYSEAEVRLFLEQGSLSILLPFARELLLSTCARLQVPPMMLTMVKLAPLPFLNISSHQQNIQDE